MFPFLQLSIQSSSLITVTETQVDVYYTKKMFPMIMYIRDSIVTVSMCNLKKKRNMLNFVLKCLFINTNYSSDLIM